MATVVTTPRQRDLPDGTSVTEWLTAAGELHRDPRDGPALVIYWPNGGIMEESYCFHDRLHREDGPAVIEYDECGSICAEERWLDGLELARWIEAPKGSVGPCNGGWKNPKVVARPRRALLDLRAPSAFHGCHSERRRGSRGRLCAPVTPENRAPASGRAQE